MYICWTYMFINVQDSRGIVHGLREYGLWVGHLVYNIWNLFELIWISLIQFKKTTRHLSFTMLKNVYMYAYLAVMILCKCLGRNID